MEFFAKASAWLSGKAGVGAIDWTALAAKGQDSVFNTQYMDQYMLPAFDRCSKVIDTLDLTRATSSEALDNYAKIKSQTDIADKLLVSVKSGASAVIELINPLHGVEVFQTGYSVFIWHVWAMAMTSANMHVTAQIHKSGIPDADIAYHASLATMMFNLITRLNDFGLLKPIKKSTTNGLGAVPVAVIALGAVAIVAVAWAVIAIYEQASRNAVVEAACKQASESGDPKAIANCQALFSTPEGSVAGAIPKAVGDVVEKVAIAAMVGAGLYLMVVFGPGIATNLKKTMAAWKSG